MAALASGLVGLPSDANAFAISAMSTVFRRGAISASMRMWAKCSTARAPPTAPPLYPTKAAGLLRKAKLTNTLAFFHPLSVVQRASGRLAA